MTEISTNSKFEERKLALDERKLESENEFRRRDIELKERESGQLRKLLSPLTVPIIVGILTLAGSIAATFFDGRQTLELERERFRFSKEQETQKQDHELILKMISVGDVNQARTNLEFLAETGLISDKSKAEKILNAKARPVLPVPAGSSTDRDDCGAARATRVTNSLLNLPDGPVYVESCALDVPGGASGFYRYVYRIENKGTNVRVGVRWDAAGIISSALPPGQSMTATFLAVEGPNAASTDIFFGPTSKATVDAIVPLRSP